MTLRFRVPLTVRPVHWNDIRFRHDDVIKWKHFPRYWPFVRGIHRSSVNSHHKGQWRGALMFSLICARINGWVNNIEAGDLRRHRTHYDVTVMVEQISGLYVRFMEKRGASPWTGLPRYDPKYLSTRPDVYARNRSVNSVWVREFDTFVTLLGAAPVKATLLLISTAYHISPAPSTFRNIYRL